MKRSLDDAFFALRQQIADWARGTARPDVRVFVYPPELEPLVLERLPALAAECEQSGLHVELVDVGQGFLQSIERRKPLLERMAKQETEHPERVVHDLGQLAERYLSQQLREPLGEGACCRILANTGSLATLVSYSALSNDLYGDQSFKIPTVIAFPGEGDDRALNLMLLRRDGNYRIPRI